MRTALWLLCAAGLLSAESFSYWIQPCSAEISQKASCISSDAQLYGEARPIQVGGQRGAAIYVNPDVTQLGDEIAAAASDDRLLRDAIVYLTCLHESGHALGLTHTGKFADIMYSFGFGGNIVEYFERYRHSLGSRSDIRMHSGISDYDRERLLELFRNNP
jgi:hypothetical protein